MRTNLLKTLLIAVGLATSVGSQAGSWSTIFTEDYNDASTYNNYWTSGNTGRYTVNQTLRSGSTDDYVMESVPVSTGNNGTTITYTGLTSSNSAVDSYQTSEDFRISFEFNFSYNSNQAPYFQIMNSSGTEVVGFYSTTSGSASLRLGANGSSAGGTELATYTIGYQHKTPTTYNTVTIYTTTKDDKKGTYMDVIWAGSEEATTYTIDAENVVHIGKLVHNTKRYYNHFVFDNLKVELYSESEIVAAPSAQITAINGASRTVAITAQDATHKVYYYMGEDSSNPTEYSEPFTVSESATLSYYSESTSGTKSDVQTLDIKCEAVTLNAPVIRRMGANSYKLTATQTAVDGLTAVPTIEYRIDGDDARSVVNGGTITGVDGDIEAWAEAEGYTNSATTTETYIAAYETEETWSYDLNSFPSTYSITAIADAIDEDSKTTLNDVEMYNLKNIEKPNLYVENSAGWLLRNQSANAFKAYGSAVSIAVNNVKTTDVIYVAAYMDNYSNAIASVKNGSVKYSYDLREYFIVPEADGAVNVTLQRGTNLSTVKVGTTNSTLTITSAGYATYVTKSDVSIPEGVEVYGVKVNDKSTIELISLEKDENIAKGTAILVKGEPGDYTFVATEHEAATISGNKLIAVTEATTIEDTSDDNYYALAQIDGKVGFYKIKAGVTIPAGKAVLHVNLTDAKQFYPLDEAADVTAINGLSAATTAATDSAFYTLQGVKTVKPSKGLYIHNGKKVIIK